MPSHWKVFLFKQAYKFSAAHMTVFPDGTKEALHGHNYRVHLTVHLEDASFKNTVPFSALKQELKPLCEAWDEKILIAKKNPFCQIKTNGDECEVTLCEKRYMFPADEVVVLEIENVTTELLAKEFCDRLMDRFKGKAFLKVITALEVKLEEADGQGTSYFVSVKA